MQDIECYCQFFRKPISTKTKNLQNHKPKQNKKKKKEREKKKERNNAYNESTIIFA